MAKIALRWIGSKINEKSCFKFYLHFIKKSKAIIGNPGQNVCGLFPILTKFLFTTSESELEYCRQNVNTQVASRVAERVNTWKQCNCLCLELVANAQPDTQKANFDRCARKFLKIICETFPGKTYFTKFRENVYNIVKQVYKVVNMSARLSEIVDNNA